MKNFLIAVLFTMLPCTAYSQVTEGPSKNEPPSFRNKPVLCMDKDQMIENSKRNELVPLVGSIGNTFNGETDTFPAFFLVVYNQQAGTYSFLEFHKDGWACLLGGGRNGLIFDYEEIDRQLGWE
jgi:hypothetical protein